MRLRAIPHTTASWEERLYHINIPVVNGYLETDDEIAIDTLLARELFEKVPEKKTTSKSKTPVVAKE